MCVSLSSLHVIVANKQHCHITHVPHCQQPSMKTCPNLSAQPTIFIHYLLPLFDLHSFLSSQPDAICLLSTSVSHFYLLSFTLNIFSTVFSCIIITTIESLLTNSPDLYLHFYLTITFIITIIVLNFFILLLLFKNNHHR